MSDEQTLAVRAAVHAALGDPARLAIVDTLTLGDASPGEVAHALDLPSNLMAHHLKVLAWAGLVERTRSEGDRRRTYVRLVPNTLALLTPPAPQPTPGVVFVCTHNSARSQLAAALWSQHSAVPVACAGTHPAARVHPRAVRTARRHGLSLRGARTAHVADVLRPDDLLIAVCDNAHEALADNRSADHRPTDRDHRRLHWSIPDPARTDTDQAFEAAYNDLAGRIARLAPTFTPRADPGADHV